MDVNNASKSHQKQVSSNSRSGLQQSLRDAILGGSGNVSNGDVNNSNRDMVRIGNLKYLYMLIIIKNMRILEYVSNVVIYTDISEWPRNSIPRRVKKLSWEDEYDLGDSSVFDLGIPHSGTSVHSEYNGSVQNNGTGAGVASIASGTIISSIVAHHQQDRDNSTLTDTEGQVTAISPASHSSGGGPPPPYMLQDDHFHNSNLTGSPRVQVGRSIYF